MQAAAPSDEPGVQYRFEFVAGKLLYALRVQDNDGGGVSTDVKNRCMCDTHVDDPGVNFQLLRDASELGKACPSLGVAGATAVQAGLEHYAQSINAHVLAIEGTVASGALHVFDVNLSSNYNYELEEFHGAPHGAWQVLETMLPPQ